MHPGAVSALRRRHTPGCLTSAMAATRFCETSWCVSCRVFALGVLEPEAVAVPWYASGCNQNTTATATATDCMTGHTHCSRCGRFSACYRTSRVMPKRGYNCRAAGEEGPPPPWSLFANCGQQQFRRPPRAYHDALLALAACCRLHCWFAAACPGLPCDHLKQGGVAVDALKQPPPAREPEQSMVSAAQPSTHC